ncbi:PREDICTED: rubisco accumulation factor 1.1, chloroplastic-like [Lupinus angustifolius]|nr:PREDICTED: rubisco accumulation factor 1.1, chloroplastic-like [Lupinus angustifolius]
MLSLSVNTLNLNPISPNHHHHHHHRTNSLKPISATLNFDRFSNNPPPIQQNLYQPFRPPPTPLPSKFSKLDLAARIDILANRLGQWYEYAPLIPALFREGFSPPSLEEATGITGVEQNRLIVASQVRESLIHSKADPEIIAAFDNGGEQLLYEIRLLSASQRTAAASFIVQNGFDGKGAQELARSIKDYPSRRGDKGWEKFDYNLPGDCLSFMYYRQAMEHRDLLERASVLDQALRVAESEKAKNTVLGELRRKDGVEDDKEDEVEIVRVPVVRLKIGEVAEATSVVVLPVCKAEKTGREISEAPFECRSEGEFGVVVADKGWERWVVLPRWDPLVGLGKGGVVISFPDARVLPWKAKRWYKEESILVVADRNQREVGADDGFYLVKVDGGGLKVERGLALKEIGVEESLGAVVLVVRPPRDEDDEQLSEEDWD